MATRKGLDGYFMKYGISKTDIDIIENVCQAADVESDWLEEEVLAVYQKRRNSGAKMTVDSAYKILNTALNKL